ncbi:flagellar hook-basal body complex protein FliE [Roseomonas sp. SSH11]|uniref:Flagellar hook-basal body complex protein FliE n=1 Tax=Pararoseomonas baculiformis TaxID=2820812 RepID=A0ABS4AK89_9PROT|nr:flagellar hook-basal body complex protein FliE [Pararoseomonas baculiformis]MBP0447457.1 flagellar hook-basal body complex protein FliE [Pararoseomonas baculiformis]
MTAIVSGAHAALNAYRTTAQGKPGGSTASSGHPTDGFGAMLERAMQGAVDATRAADTTSVQAMTGQAGVTDVVLAVSRAEVALQTTVALRDRVVSAYQEIMRMPI